LRIVNRIINTLRDPQELSWGFSLLTTNEIYAISVLEQLVHLIH